MNHDSSAISVIESIVPAMAKPIKTPFCQIMYSHNLKKCLSKTKKHNLWIKTLCCLKNSCGKENYSVLFWITVKYSEKIT